MSNVIDLVSRLKEKQEIASEMSMINDPTSEWIENDLIHLVRIIDLCYKLYFGLPIHSDLQSITYKHCECYFDVVYVTILKYASKHSDSTCKDILTKFQTMLAINIGRCFVINNRNMEVPSKLLDYNDITMKFSAISELICRINHSENLQKGINEIKEILASKNQSTE
jgi:hypothetical protein